MFIMSPLNIQKKPRDFLPAGGTHRGTSSPQAGRWRDLLFNNQFEAVDADGAAEFRTFADGDAGQMGVDSGADVVR